MFTYYNCAKCQVLYGVSMSRLLAVWGCRMASVRSGRGCSMTDTAGSRWLQLTHHKAQLSPAVKIIRPVGKHI